MLWGERRSCLRVRVEPAHVGERDTAGRWTTAGGRHHKRSHLTKITGSQPQRRYGKIIPARKEDQQDRSSLEPSMNRRSNIFISLRLALLSALVRCCGPVPLSSATLLATLIGPFISGFGRGLSRSRGSAFQCHCREQTSLFLPLEFADSHKTL